MNMWVYQTHVSLHAIPSLQHQRVLAHMQRDMTAAIFSNQVLMSSSHQFEDSN